MTEKTKETSSPIPVSTPAQPKPPKRRGNPNWVKGAKNAGMGRPAGAKNKATLVQEAIKQEAEDLLIKYLPQVVQEVINQASKGNMQAAKMLLDRAIPVKRAVEISGKDGKDFGVRIIIDNVINTIESQQEAEDGEFTEANKDSG